MLLFYSEFDQASLGETATTTIKEVMIPSTLLHVTLLNNNENNSHGKFTISSLTKQ